MKAIQLFNLVSIEQKIERWQQAIRVLKGLSPHERRKHWNMAWWGERNECGTIACAAGHCALDPWFRRRGLQMHFKYKRNYWHMYFNTTHVANFFGDEGTRAIFYNGRKRSVTRVINEMREYIRFLKQHKAITNPLLRPQFLPTPPKPRKT